MRLKKTVFERSIQSSRFIIVKIFDLLYAREERFWKLSFDEDCILFHLRLNCYSSVGERFSVFITYVELGDNSILSLKHTSSFWTH